MVDHFSLSDDFWTALGIGFSFVLILFFLILIARQRHVPPKRSKPPSVELENTIVQEAPALPDTWVARLTSGLARTRGALFRGIDELFSSSSVAELRKQEVLESLFELLVQADIGVTTSNLLMERVAAKLQGEEWQQADPMKNLLRAEILKILEPHSVTDANIPIHQHEEGKYPHVVLMVGVNGVGKTTTTGKLAFKASQMGKKVTIGAADTFRAAAVEQLQVWAQRSDAQLVKLQEGSDPSSVAYDAVKIACANGADLCLVDTAGRLHSRTDLMQELGKLGRVLGKVVPGAPHEVFLVLDATTGQNALQQAKLFREVVPVTGLILTKLDGSAKGGVVVAIANELQIPIRYVGVGERVEDLQKFCPQVFVAALFEDKVPPIFSQEDCEHVVKR